MRKMKVIDCGKQNERIFRKLLEEPHGFDQPEFEQLVERFRSRLAIDDIIELMVKRVRAKEYRDQIEKKALLAIAEGRLDEAQRLTQILERRRKAGFKSLSPEPKSLPQSS